MSARTFLWPLLIGGSAAFVVPRLVRRCHAACSGWMARNHQACAGG